MHCHSRICIRWLLSPALLLWVASCLAIDYPGPPPGKAVARIVDSVLHLENDVLAARWQLNDGHLRPLGVTDKQSKVTTPGGGELLRLELAGGKTIRASDLALASEYAARYIARANGRGFAATFASRDGRLRVRWQAVLHDGANYVRQELTIEPRGKDLPLKAIVPLDLRVAGAKQAGEVRGSPVTAGNLFFACENPLATNEVTASNVRCCLPYRRVLKAGESCRCRSVIGVGPPGQMRRAFLCYIERERPRPYQPFLHYNSWYDIAWGNRKFNEQQSLDAIEQFGRELVERRGVTLDSFVFDDGWDDDRTLWGFHQGFPHGFTPLMHAAAKYHSAVGTWLSPWGGYGEPQQRRLKYGRQQGFETNANGFSLAGPKYYARFRAVCIEMLKKYGVNYFKFDGVGGGNAEPGQPYGPLSPEATADLEALLRLTADLRQVRPTVFINITTGTWPSPFWLLYGDSIWRNGQDMGFSGQGSRRQQWINYRDAVTRQMVAARSPLFPLNSIMNQGITYAREASSLGNDLKELKDEFRMFFADGTQLQELYMTPSMMTPEMLDALAEAANWSRANADVLVDTHWIGGDPNRGEVYGYASWSPRKAIVALRNPTSKPARYTLDLAAALELPAPHDYRLKSPWKGDANRPSILIPVGQPHRFDLKPFEVLVLEARNDKGAGENP
jgi:hypothetical protein